ncbi:SAV_2336 N-terminal domain-related protein [Streptomyces sp. NPDC051815]|uniref:SAV_2336 N-terminal domain-related protein n=1 Tax=Streptomyces sp. NPDC051815 TaxID=3365674 RepID=UPI00378746E1
MIEDLLAALADGADAAGPGPGLGPEEIADILWLAARVDPAAARPPGAPAPAPPDGPAPEAAPPSPAAGPLPGGRDEDGGGEADGPGPAVRLFPAARHDPAGKPADTAGGRRGSPLRLPRAASLDDPLSLMRALRPVGRRAIGGPGEELDEQLTVERSIERMVPTPVLRPAESRWLDLALVVDAHHSMLLWADLVDELRAVLTRSGVFRDVRTWQLTGTGPGATPMLTRGRGGPPRNPLELADPAGRRLILVLSDTVAAGWREVPLQGVLRHWCTHNAVAVLNVLPERLWTRGAVRPVPYALRADRPAAATRSWQRSPAGGRARTGRRHRPPDVVPVVGIAPGSLARLVRVVAGDGRWRRLACLRLDARHGAPEAPGPGPDPTGHSPLEVVERFRAGASPTAQQLAAHLAAVPLTLPVMTLVRRSLLRDSEHGHLAEVALGGLFEPWGDEQGDERGAEGDRTEFEFRPGVREVLLGSQLRGDVAAVRELVRRRVWEYLARRRGTGPDFPAVRVADGREGHRGVAEDSLPFATRPPAADPGLGDRVVRVRHDARAEPLDVGILLTPRLVLTVGDGAVPLGAEAWVRPGDREVPCRTVWWDDAAPRVLLLEAGEDLADPGLFAQPLSWAAADHRPAQVRVDGRTDGGAPASLTGEVVPYGGDRNGELVRLSAEPDAWTHYRGGPVSADGTLVGVVHTVWPNRLVFLSAHALLEHRGFRGVLARRGSAGTFTSPDAVRTVCLAVRTGTDGMHPIGSSPREETRAMLLELMSLAAVGGRVSTDEGDAPVLVLLEAPGARAKAARLLARLPGRMAAYGERRMEGMHASLAVAVGADAAEAARLAAHPAVGDRLHRTVPSGALLLALSDRVHDELDGLLGLPDRLAVARAGAEGEGWLCTDPYPPAEALGQLLAEADELLGDTVAWPVCGIGATATEPQGCIGVRLPGYERCLAHLAEGDRRAFLGTLAPGVPVDFRGTTFEHGLLGRVLAALAPSGADPVRLGSAAFDRAYFADGWDRPGAEFTDRASFTRAVFARRAAFVGSVFEGPASFDGVEFQHVGDFDRSRFRGRAFFRRAVFRGSAGFTDAVFLDGLSFSRAVLEGSADLNGMRVTGEADFARTRFGGLTGLSAAGFAGPASFAAATWELGLLSTGTAFEDSVDFTDAVFRARVRFEGVRFGAGPDHGLTDRPGRWRSRRRPDGTWDVRRDPDGD